MEIKKIVVPVDFQKNTQKLVDYAVFIAKQLSAEIGFCHVLEPFVMGDMMIGSPSFSDFDVKRSADAEERMANLIEDSEALCPKCTGKVLLGETVDEIVGYAKNEKGRHDHYRDPWSQRTGEDPAGECGRKGGEKGRLPLSGNESV